MSKRSIGNNVMGKPIDRSNPDEVKAFNKVSALYSALKKYHITKAEYDSLLEKQHNLCAICERPASGKHRLHIDHDHKTNKVRGLLCINCNHAIGKLNDEPWIAMSAASYLLQHQPNR